MKHDSSARRKAYVPVEDTKPKERRLYLVPKLQVRTSNFGKRTEKQSFNADRWFYTSDLFAIPFCLMWILLYYFAADSGQSVADPSFKHFLSTTTYHAVVT